MLRRLLAEERTAHVGTKNRLKGANGTSRNLRSDLAELRAIVDEVCHRQPDFLRHINTVRKTMDFTKFDGVRKKSAQRRADNRGGKG
jgi:hypothetical protein